jgi:lysozyme family protein
MADFYQAVAITLREEGGFDNNEETGEIVNHGWTNWSLAALGLPHSVSDIQAMTVEQATELYRENFWMPLHGDQIADQALCNKVFDVSVNQGLPTGTRLLQEACNDLSPTPFIPLVVDGVIGPASIAEINSLPPSDLLAAFRARAAARYRQVAAENPALAGDLEGWLTRLAS